MSESKPGTALARLREKAAERVRDVDLVPLHQVARHVAESDGVPLKEAAAAVLDDLARNEAVPIFRTLPGEWPANVSEPPLQAVIPRELVPRKRISAADMPPRFRSESARRFASAEHHSPEFFGRPPQHAGPTFGRAESSPVEPVAVAVAPGRAGFLALLRAVWVTATPLRADGAHLEACGCGALAMRTEAAAEMFGCGVDDEQVPELPAALPVHDAERWGFNRTAGARQRALVRVADAVHAAMQPGSAARHGLAREHAAAWVLEGLRGLAGVTWFRLQPGRAPVAVEPGTQWRPAYPSTEQRRAQVARENTAEPWAVMLGAAFDQPDAEEAAARGLAGSADTWPALCDPSIDWPALPALVGTEGLFEWLRLHWVERAGSADDSASVRAFLAVPAAAVAKLSWLPVAVVASAAAAPTASIVSQAAAVLRIVQPVGGAWPHSEGSWSEAEKTAILKMRANGMTEEEIAAVVGVSREAFRQQVGSKSPRKKKGDSAALRSVVAGLGTVVHKIR